VAADRAALFRAVIDASRLGDRAGVVRAGEVLLAAMPDDPAALGLAGTLACQAGDVERGCALLVRGLGHAPDNADLRHNAIRALLDLGRFDAAVALGGDEAAEMLLNLGRAFNLAGRSREALAPLAAAARAAPGDPEILVALGLTQADLGGFAQAERAYRLALEAVPGFAPAVLNLGIVLEQSNRIGELTDLASEDGPAYLRALVARHDGRFAEALTLAETVGDEVDASLRAQLIGQLAERLGQVETAIAAFEAMNRAVAADPASRAVSAAEYRERVEARTARLTPARVSGWGRVAIDTARPAPVFLGGFPRSGTTLLDTILMGHPQVTVLEEEPVV
jgi:tetratricopeptide (TPR) repeat protein